MKQEFAFSKENNKIAQDIIKKYPEDRRFSAIMPLLTLAQKQNGGYLVDEIIFYLANYLHVSEMSFYEVAKFYSMYKFSKVGKYHIQICKSVVCFVLGSLNLYEFCKQITGTLENDVSEDGLFSVSKVECLGACVNSVAIKINDYFYEDVTEEKLIYLVEHLKAGKPLEKIISSNVKTPQVQNQNSKNVG